MNQFRIKKDPSQKFKRPRNTEDIKYRRMISMNYENLLKSTLSEDCDYCFHGTPIWNAIKIITSKQITAEIDRNKETPEPTNKSGFISVTTIKNVWFTIKQFTDLSNFDYPAGVIFVLKAKNYDEFKYAQNTNTIHNVNFSQNPEQLQFIITSPESKQIIKDIIENTSSLPSNILVTFEEFLDQIKTNENI